MTLCKMAAFISGICGLDFWIVGEGGDVSSIFMYSLLYGRGGSRNKNSYKLTIYYKYDNLLRI